MAEVRHLVRIVNTDLQGSKPTPFALRRVKGVNVIMGQIVCNVVGISFTKRLGELSDAEIKQIEEVLLNPAKFNIPDWVFNRPRDPETNESRHNLTNKLAFSKEQDIKKLQKIKCYRGIRHSSGLTSRGQRTKSNFRKTKTKGKGTLGVKRKAGRKAGRM